MAVPLLIGTGAMVDIQKAGAQRTNMKGAMDMAVLAAASNNKLTDSQKKSYAEQIFEQNYRTEFGVDVNVDVQNGEIRFEAAAQVPTSVAAAIGIDSIEISEESVAVMDRRNTICVLSVAENGRDRVAFWEDTKFSAPTCVVQSNSRSSSAIFSSSSTTPMAKAFCSAGGAVGNFEPYVKGNCQAVADPYANRTAPKPGMCMPDSTFVKRTKLDGFGVPFETELATENILNPTTIARLKRKYRNDMLEVPVSENIIRRNQVLFPGTYCGGLTIPASGVTMMPGNYIMLDGALTIKNGADVFADRVSIVMNGKGSVAIIEEGAELYLRAPKMGPTAGLAFFQDVSALGGGKSEYPNGLNVIASGGELNVVGALYFPTQALDVSGSSIIGARAPATSFIAYDVAFAGSTMADVKIDHVAAGLPPLLPISDDAARLIK